MDKEKLINEICEAEYFGGMEEALKVIAPIQAEIDELEQFCINIYMSLSVSELHKVTAPVEEAWNKGQKLWLRNTKHRGEG